MQVKGRVAFGSPLARFNPPGKAVRRFLLPPRKCQFFENGWLGVKLGRKRGGFTGGLRKKDEKEGSATRHQHGCEAAADFAPDGGADHR